MKKQAKQLIIQFIDELELLSSNDSSLVVLVSEARELMKYNEWLVAIENMIDNLVEIDWVPDQKMLELAIQIFETLSPDNSRLTWIISARYPEKQF